MQLLDAGGQLASRPSPNAQVSPGWANNSPSGASPATVADPDCWNAIMAEIANVITATGATLSKTNTSQLLTAIQTLIGAAAAAAGEARNLSAYLNAAGSSITFTADEIVVETALGGQPYKLSNFNQTLNIGTTGAGGMDTGTAPPSGFVAVYAIYNPTTLAQSILACNASTSESTIYGGSHMPSGYTASGLIAVLPTNGTPALLPGKVTGRKFAFGGNYPTVFTGQSSSTSYTEQLISGLVPTIAKTATILLGITSGSAGNSVPTEVAGDSLGTGVKHKPCYIAAAGVGGFVGGETFEDIPMVFSTPQFFWRGASNSFGNVFSAYVTDYTW